MTEPIDIHHLAPQCMAGVDAVHLRFATVVLVNGPAAAGSSNQSRDCHARSATLKSEAKPQSPPRQRDIRQNLIEADLVDCMVAIVGQLSYSTQIPVCLWFEVEKNALDTTSDSRLFDGETELSLVA